MKTLSIVALFASISIACGDSGSGNGGNDSGTQVAASTTGSGQTAAITVATVTSGVGPSSSASGMQLQCTSYCTDITATCQGDLRQYFGVTPADQVANCNSICAKFTPGMFNDGMGTLGCRAYHLDAAKVSADAAKMHCEHAGPLGGEVCGDEKKNFCALATSFCATQFPAGDLCETDIANIDTSKPYSQEQTSGDTLACRMYHLTAAVGDANAHCPHADGAAPCQ